MRRGSLPIVLALALAACQAAKPPAPAPHELRQKWLGYLEDGKTKKADILWRLGPPSDSFEEGRIVIYRMVFRDKKGITPIPKWFLVGKYQLLMKFNANKVFERHKLLEN